MTTRRRVAGIAFTCLVPFLANPAVASADPPRLRIVGRGTAFIDITLPAGVRLDQRRARIEVRRGTYAGWWATRLGESPTSTSNQAGSLLFVDPEEPVTNPSTVIGFRSEPLEAGRYRVYLATDGEASIDVPAQGLGKSRDVRPHRRTTSVSGRVPLTVLPGGLISDGHRATWRLPPSALAVSSVRTYAQPGVTIENLTACLTEVGEDCAGPTAYGHTSSFTSDHAARLSTVYLPGRVPAGPVDAVQHAQGGPRVLRASTDVFYLVTVP